MYYAVAVCIIPVGALRVLEAQSPRSTPNDRPHPPPAAPGPLVPLMPCPAGVAGGLHAGKAWRIGRAWQAATAASTAVRRPPHPTPLVCARQSARNRVPAGGALRWAATGPLPPAQPPVRRRGAGVGSTLHVCPVGPSMHDACMHAQPHDGQRGSPGSVRVPRVSEGLPHPYMMCRE